MTEFPETRSNLIAQIRSPKDKEAWEEFVLIYRPVIYRIARRRGMQDADAQDLVQIVLMRVSGAIDRWNKEPGTRFRHWLRRVAKNTIITALTRRPKDVTIGGSESLEPIAEADGAATDIERKLDIEYMREQYLRAAVTVRTDVNAETWRVFELTVIDGKSCEEAASLTGKSVGAVYAARSRVMRRLRDQVQGLEQS